MPRTRLSDVLAVGLARSPVPTGVAPTMADHAIHGANRRVVLKVAGLTNNIRYDKMIEALEKIRTLITEERVTTIVWDGDKLNYQHADGSPATLAFTAMLPVLHKEFPHLEFIYFKKEKSVGQLLASAAPKEDEFKNMLGPYEFLTFTNTNSLSPTEPIPLHPTPNQHYAIAFPDDTNWKELGLLGLRWLKTVARVDSMQYFVLGKGYVVSQELKAIVADPDKYPSGIAKRSVEFLGVEIEDARNAA